MSGITGPSWSSTPGPLPGIPITPAAGGDRGDNTARNDAIRGALRPVPAADRQTDEEHMHPDSPLAWEQVVIDGRVRCSHCGEATPCSSKVRLHEASPEHRVNCVPVNSCYLTCRPLEPATRPAHADAVMADLGAAITEGVTEAGLREAVARELFRRQSPEHGWGAGLAYEAADELLALPEMRALLDAAAKVQRVEAALDERSVVAFRSGQSYVRVNLVRAALGGEG